MPNVLLPACGLCLSPSFPVSLGVPKTQGSSSLAGNTSSGLGQDVTGLRRYGLLSACELRCLLPSFPVSFGLRCLLPSFPVSFGRIVSLNVICNISFSHNFQNNSHVS